MNGPSTTTAHLLVPRPYPAKLSLVVPVFNEEDVIPLLRAELKEFAAGIRCPLEVVVVNDGSTDRTITLLAEWAQADNTLKVLHLSRNFGHQIAATAGLDFASGDAVVLIDADLQDPPGAVHQMIERYCEGYDVIYGQRVSRDGESAFKRFSAWLFYRLMRLFVYQDLPVDTGDFRLVSRPCLNALIQLREQHRFLRGMVAWVGFPQIAVPYQRRERAAGATKYPVSRMLRLAWTAATSFSILPLRFSLLLGVFVALLGMEEFVRALYARFMGQYVPGWTSLMVVTCAIGSALLIGFGILGEYVGKLYEQAKDRPLYIVARTFNVPPSDPPQNINLSPN
jgi:polyisoprenyl-phosphate glycosyltransferase